VNDSTASPKEFLRFASSMLGQNYNQTKSSQMAGFLNGDESHGGIRKKTPTKANPRQINSGFAGIFFSEPNKNPSKTSAQNERIPPTPPTFGSVSHPRQWMAHCQSTQLLFYSAQEIILQNLQFFSLDGLERWGWRCENHLMALT